MTTRSHTRPVLIMAAIVLLASLALRLHAIDVFLGGDETKWVCRSINFSAALRDRRLADTYQSEHPGVVTMWLGTLAVPLDAAGEWIGLCEETGGNKLTRVDGTDTLLRLPSLIFQGRRAVTVATWLGIAALLALLWRLLGPTPALLATALVALGPFYLALSRVLHLDAVLSTLMALSVVSLLVYVLRGRQVGYLLLSAVTGGLAIANKSPGMFLAPWTALVLLSHAWSGAADQRRERLLRAVRRGLLWGAVAAAVVVVLWPSLWVNPVETLRQVVGAAVGYAEQPHGNSNYFWHAIRPDPGPAFYPIAWAFRSTPLVWLGLAGWLLMPLGLVRRRQAAELARPGLWLAMFAVLYGLFMTLGAKKFDRYVLPSVISIDIVAGAGWALVVSVVADRLSRWREELLAAGLAAVLLVGQVGLLWPTAPYYFSYYNPVLGGARAARELLLVGWGEGMEKAAAYLNAKPGAESFHVNTAHIAQFAPFFRGHTSSAGDLDLAESDYYVFYVNTIQREREPQTLLRFYGQTEPEHVVWVDGIDYVWVYANTLFEPALEHLDEAADPARDLLLLDVNSALRRQYGGPLPLAYIDGTVAEDTIVERLAAVTADRQRVWYLTFPETVGDPRGVIARHLQEQAQLTETVEWPGMKLTLYGLSAEATFALPRPTYRTDALFGGNIRLVGYDVVPYRDEGRLVVRLYWRPEQTPEHSYTVFNHVLNGADERVAQRDGRPRGGEWPTDRWIAGETVVDEHRIDVPADAWDDLAQVAVGLYRVETGERLPAVDAQGQPLPESRVLLPVTLGAAR